MIGSCDSCPHRRAIHIELRAVGGVGARAVDYFFVRAWFQLAWEWGALIVRANSAAQMPAM